MKKWVQKLIEQFDFDWNQSPAAEPTQDLSEDRATLLYILDVFNKHLFEIDAHPVRKIRETLDEFAKELVKPEGEGQDRLLFRLRQFFSAYRIDEYSYIQKTFDEFKGIIWDFIDQLSEDLRYQQNKDDEVLGNLEELKEAVESNSIDVLKTKSRQFIDFYVEHHTREEEHKSRRMDHLRKNLAFVKRKLVEANESMNRDHLTSAYNRKSFDDKITQYWHFFELTQNPVTLFMLDIDHFKKVNDTFGHATGDFVLKECVRVLQDVFCNEGEFVARVGGEEFAILLPNMTMETAPTRAEWALQRVRKEAYLIEDKELRFTVSIGVAQLESGESVDAWMKRADEALYKSKASGRNKFTLATPVHKMGNVA